MFLVFIPFILSAQKQITLEDIFVNGTFNQKSVQGLRSMNDGNHYTVMENGARVVKYSYQTGQKVSEVFDLSSIANAPISRFNQYEFSNDETKILLTTDIEPIYRHSYTAAYYVWNSVTQELTPLSENGKQQLATFSPDGERVALVRDNNLFIKSLRFGTESQVTYDGERNQIINGAPDWVYEEEFGFSKAFAWSPDSKFLAFMQFDESEVREFSMAMFKGLQPAMDEYSLYPGEETFKYPKAGEKNSVVTLHLYNVSAVKTTKIDLGNYEYIPRIKWTNNPEILSVITLNRHQNDLKLFAVNASNFTSKVILNETDKAFVDIQDNLTFLTDNSFIWTSEKSGFNHIYHYSKEGKLINQV
ncbi:MAG TPA: S9 family peptidase, partial [Prolixibacteraceae bacterium]|nr:S9 family peptidase [Prolixibacteraceae bacterium]